MMQAVVMVTQPGRPPMIKFPQGDLAGITPLLRELRSAAELSGQACLTVFIPRDEPAGLDLICSDAEWFAMRRESEKAAIASPPFLDAALAVVRAERLRQISIEGYHASHDDAQEHGELAAAAAAYAVRECRAIGEPMLASNLWPWDNAEFNQKDHRRNCERAAALLVAELERLERLDRSA